MKKVKKLIIALVAAMIVLSLLGCGGSSKKEAPAGTDTAAVDTVTAEENSEETTEEEAAEEVADEAAKEDEESGLSLISPEFKQTMDDYESWFDHYCEVMKKCKDNPSDLELLSEMTDLLSEEATMLEQLENMDESEMNAAELAYYLEVTARIEKKLLEVADY